MRQSDRAIAVSVYFVSLITISGFPNDSATIFDKSVIKSFGMSDLDTFVLNTNLGIFAILTGPHHTPDEYQSIRGI